jgi:two-component system chemotaxis response regulator CheY
MKIVVVDDEPDVRLVLSMQLKIHGHDVVGEAADGAEAVEVCEATKPDAVVLDLLMPRTTGFEAIPRLQALDPAPLVVAYSAVAGDFVRNEMARLGVPLVLKSGDIGALLEALTGN